MAYQSKHTGAAIDAAIDAVVAKEKQWDDKQDKLTGNAGQLVIFDENGNPIAQDMPDIDIDTDNLVTLEGGGEIDMAELFGEGPYVISFTPDEEIVPSGSGIVIGPDEPVDGDVWIDTDDDDEEQNDDYVSSFNGRGGDVVPQDGDYTAAMVGADAAGSAAAALSAAKEYADEKIAAIPTPDVSGQISAHNADGAAHVDIRDAIPTKTSELTNDSGYITGFTETDPTVPAWAKAASKPSYTAHEVGAVATDDMAKVPYLTSVVPTPIPNAEYRGVAYGNPNGIDVFVGLRYQGDNDTAVYSLDGGTTWATTPLPTCNASYKYWISTAFGNGRFVAVCRTSSVGAYSDDGIHWHAMSMPGTLDWGNVMYNQGVFVAMPYGSSNTSYAYSTDGVTWTLKTLPVAGYWSAAASGNGMFLIHDISGKYTLSSTDGVTWTSRTSPPITVTSMYFAGGYYFGTASPNNSVAYTADGSSWSTSTLPRAASYGAMMYGNDTWVLLTQLSDFVFYSSDLTSWSTASLGKNAYLYQGAFGAGHFVALPGSTLGASSAVSEDGIHWHNVVADVNLGSGDDVRSALADALRSSLGFADMVCGSYVGWGSTGNRYILMSCPFRPKAVLVWATNGSLSYANGTTKYYYHAFATADVPAEPYAGTKMLWINGNDIMCASGTYGSYYYNLDDSGVTYAYIIFG